jgi:spermidine synthase
LHEDESAYNYIQVQEDENGYRYLYLNEGQGIHSQWHPEIYFYGRTWDFFLTAPYFNAPPFSPADVNSLLIVGLAGGTIARQHIEIYGNLPIDGVEIDPDIIAASARYFDMNGERMPSLTVFAQDGRYMVNRLDKGYTVIAVDAYRPPYIPWHMTTVEFFQEIRDHLTGDGVAAINVGRTNTDRRLVDALTATMLQVFPSVHAMDVPASFNTLLVALVQRTSAEEPPRKPAPSARSSRLQPARHTGAGSRLLTPTTPSELIFTDDRARQIAGRSLVLNFLLSGGGEQLRTGN